MRGLNGYTGYPGGIDAKLQHSITALLQQHDFGITNTIPGHFGKGVAFCIVACPEWPLFPFMN